MSGRTQEVLCFHQRILGGSWSAVVRLTPNAMEPDLIFSEEPNLIDRTDRPVPRTTNEQRATSNDERTRFERVRDVYCLNPEKSNRNSKGRHL